MGHMAAQHTTPRFRRLFYSLVGLGVVALCCGIGWRYAHRDTAPPVDNSIYRADAPASTLPPQLLGGLILLRPEQLIQAPVVDGFQWPCGAPNAAMIYDAQPFGEMNQYRGGHHTGQDLNGIGGQNTDLDLPVCAAGRGLVVYSGEPSPDWGQVVVLAHRLPGQAGVVQTLYAHLNRRLVRTGQVVPRGERIGTIGTAGGRYAAHLHFETIPSLCTEAGMPGYHPAGTMNRINPADLIRKHPAPAIPDAYDLVRQLRIREAAEQSPTPAAPLQTQPGVIPVSPHQFLDI